MTPGVTKRQTSRDIRNASRFAVLRGLYTLGTPSRQDLVQVTGLSFATVSNLVNELLSLGMLVEASREDSNGGRPRARLRVPPQRGVLIGVDVAETYVHVDVFDASLTRLSRHEHELTDRSDPDYVIGEIAGCMQEAIDKHSGMETLGAGVSMPGQVEPETGVSVFAPNWAWSNVPVQSLLENKLTIPVNIDNPLKATTVAELWFGHGNSARDLITVNLGTGVGAGIAIDGQLIRGITNNAGEWGHTTLIMDGRLCRCGRGGCVEAYIGVPGLVALFEAKHPRHPYTSGNQTTFIQNVRVGLERKEPEAEWMIEQFAHYLGAALANLVNLVNPQLIILTSWTVAMLGDWLLEPTRKRMVSESIAGSAVAVELALSRIPDSPVALGMATLALESFLENAGLPSRSINYATPAG